MSEPREFKVGDVISIEEAVKLKEHYNTIAVHNSPKDYDEFEKIYNKYKKQIKFKIVALPEVGE